MLYPVSTACPYSLSNKAEGETYRDRPARV